MRKKSDKEKEILGRVVQVLNVLRIKKSTRGYAPLLDFISYAAVHPEVSLESISKYLLDNNTYIGISSGVYSRNHDKELMPSMVRTIETALERGNDESFRKLDMSEDVIERILDSDTYTEIDLLEVLGEKYADYSHEERVVFYFVKKIVKYIS